MVKFGGHGKRKQSCMMRDCHELKSNLYAANWNLPHKINNQFYARFMQMNHKERSGVIENAEESQNNYHNLTS